MKTLRFIGMALLAVILCVNLAACSDDDEPEQGNNPLIGTWISEPSTVDIQHSYYRIVFNSNGTATGSFMGSDGVDYGDVNFNYTYDESTQMLHMTETATGGSVVYAINSVDANEMSVTIRSSEGTFTDDAFIYVTHWYRNK